MRDELGTELSISSGNENLLFNHVLLFLQNFSKLYLLAIHLDFKCFKKFDNLYRNALEADRDNSILRVVMIKSVRASLFDIFRLLLRREVKISPFVSNLSMTLKSTQRSTIAELSVARYAIRRMRKLIFGL